MNIKPPIQHRRKHMNVLNKQFGYSLLELLVAMTIGILVLSSAVTMQVSNRDNFRNTTSELEMKTNAKLAAEFIGNSIRGIGVMGCRTTDGYNNGADNSSAYNIVLNTTTLAYADFNQGHEIQGYEAVGAGWTPTPDVSIGMTGMLEGSDAITLRGGIGESYVLMDRNSGDTQYTLDIPAGTDVRIAQNNFAVASTCTEAEVFHVTSTDAAIDSGIVGRAAGGGADDNSIGTWTETQGIKKSGFAELRRVATVSYYIANNPAGIPTLYRNIDGISSPLVEGVERMMFDYGIEDDDQLRNVANRYLTADQIQATCTSPLSVPLSESCLWDNVVSIRASFIMRSRDPVFGKNISKTYTLPGISTMSYSVNDRFSRAVYSSTFVARNRVIGDRTDNG